jgi:Na+/glutamate symporter
MLWPLCLVAARVLVILLMTLLNMHFYCQFYNVMIVGKMYFFERANKSSCYDKSASNNALIIIA